MSDASHGQCHTLERHRSIGKLPSDEIVTFRKNKSRKSKLFRSGTQDTTTTARRPNLRAGILPFVAEELGYYMVAVLERLDGARQQKPHKGFFRVGEAHCSGGAQPLAPVAWSRVVKPPSR
jgi:hypothetical protein